MSAIREVELEAIFDSRGQPTVEATVRTEAGASGRVGAPSGASTGTHEVRAWPQGGVAGAFRAWSGYRERLVGLECADQAGFDARLHAIDPSREFGGIGGNVATALSLACAAAAAREAGVPLWRRWARTGVDGSRFPAVVGNCMNGGRHAIGGPEIQEFLAVSDEAAPERAVRAAIGVHSEIGRRLHERFPRLALGRGDEGGWVAPLGNLEAIELLAEACAAVRDRDHLAVHPGLDLAASEFFRDGRYRYREQTVDTEGQVRFLADLVDRFGLRYLEDPLEQEAFDGFAELTRAVGARARVVGDDLYVTQSDRLARGIAAGATNAVLIKVNQVGTVSDTLATIDLARSGGLATVTSHRSGDLPEGWLAHLAVGAGSAGLKCGLLGGERVAKLNELLRLGRPRRDSGE